LLSLAAAAVALALSDRFARLQAPAAAAAAMNRMASSRTTVNSFFIKWSDLS